MVTAAILAGGLAKRLGGREKSRLLIGGETILSRQVRVLKDVAGEILLVGGVTTRRASPGLILVPDFQPGTGVLGGIYSALLASDSDRVLVVGCDMPFLTVAFLSRVIEESEGVDVVMPRTNDGWQPLCACYGQACQTTIRRRLDAGRLKVVDMIPEVAVREIGPAVVASYDPHGDLLLNINTPGDLALGRAHARRRRRVL